MKSFSYIKINGAGNDFVLIDKKNNQNIELSQSEISQICDRQNGIGADGVIFIDDSYKSDFKMDYFNADGTLGSLCGNGARCAIKYATISKRISSDNTKFENLGKIYYGEIISENIVKFYLNPPSKIKTKFKVKSYNQLITAHFVDTGSPHVVINIEDILSKPSQLNSSFTSIEEIPVEKIGKEIRNLPEFAPDGVNVNFIKFDERKIFIRSFEKGVEAETLACGTGSVAASIIAFEFYKKNPPFKLITKSNAELIVNFKIEKKAIGNVTLTGPVEIEFEGNYSI